MNQKPIVQPGDRVKAGDVIADGPATETGELALGQNVVVAFMPWGGYNFEDSILINEKLVKNDVFTSIHIEEFECVARDTKLGKEEITRDIPNVGEEALKDLDESGIVRIGAEVKAGDILVGKITPKGETQLSPEEKLLRAIFGERAGDVRDTSLRVPPGVIGVVIGARVFARKGTEKDERAQAIEDAEKELLMLNKRDEVKIISEAYYNKMRELLVGKTTASRLVDDKGKVLLPKGEKITLEMLNEVPNRYWHEIQLDSRRRQDRGAARAARRQARRRRLQHRGAVLGEDRQAHEGRRAAARRDQAGQGLPRDQEEAVGRRQDGRPSRQQGRRVAPPPRGGHAVPRGRHAGRHRAEPARRAEPYEHRPDPRGPPRLGGEVARQPDPGVPRHELVGRRAARTSCKKLFPDHAPFIDKLNQEDVGRFAKTLTTGIHLATPVFDGANEHEIKAALKMAGLPVGGQARLIDGKTGEPFDNTVTVGVMYMLKLHHLVDDKIHARSIGPYSLVTQQPLGGKAQFGGQRLGEMEVWAMEAYGAAYALQEFLTVKSDDVLGRTRMYESIVKGEHVLEAGLPESFNVLLKELQALCLDVELIEDPTMPRRARAAAAGHPGRPRRARS